MIIFPLYSVYIQTIEPIPKPSTILQTTYLAVCLWMEADVELVSLDIYKEIGPDEIPHNGS